MKIIRSLCVKIFSYFLFTYLFLLIGRARNWIANSDQETADKPADLGYWIGYQICKAYYDNSSDKNKAVHDILNIKDYKAFYEKSGAAALYN